MSARFAGRVVLVAGSGDGICRSTAVAFAREGATVMVAGPDQEELEGTVKQIRAEGGEADLVAADIASGRSADSAHMVAATVERFGSVDIAFNNATVSGPTSNLAEIEEQDWAETLAANLTGVWMAMKHELVHMESQGSGVIVNTACNMAQTGRLVGQSAYAASKAALSTLTRTAAHEYIGKGIRINAISPGPAHEPGTSFADGATPEQVAETVLWLCSSEASFVVGHDLVLDKKTV
ncbi:SDR family NAD(P)-dependent oxidoreductase [Streptomyces sp. NPDC012888]|uniref:SDR family NAD(P)-dependent oxidoreductase n=1 Tax=Streptomyces sp. NPDC012888 TaxID=3364855 RepID=UPI00368B0BA7